MSPDARALTIAHVCKQGGGAWQACIIAGQSAADPKGEGIWIPDCLLYFKYERLAKEQQLETYLRYRLTTDGMFGVK
jgi:hypothetical protein